MNVQRCFVVCTTSVCGRVRLMSSWVGGNRSSTPFSLHVRQRQVANSKGTGSGMSRRYLTVLADVARHGPPVCVSPRLAASAAWAVNEEGIIFVIDAARFVFSCSAARICFRQLVADARIARTMLGLHAASISCRAKMICVWCNVVLFVLKGLKWRPTENNSSCLTVRTRESRAL